MPDAVAGDEHGRPHAGRHGRRRQPEDARRTSARRAVHVGGRQGRVNAAAGQHRRTSVERAGQRSTIRPAMTDTTPSLATPYRTHTCGQLRADRRRHDRAPGRLGPPPARPRPADLPRPARPPRDHPGRHRQGRCARRPRDGQPGPARVRRDRSRATVAPRLPGTENAKLPTGAIELQATDRRRSCPRRRRRRSTSTTRTRRSTRSCASSTATSTSAASRCSAA